MKTHKWSDVKASRKMSKQETDEIAAQVDLDLKVSQIIRDLFLQRNCQTILRLNDALDGELEVKTTGGERFFVLKVSIPTDRLT